MFLNKFFKNFGTHVVCSEIDYVLWQCSYVPPKNLKGQKICANLQIQS